MCTKEDGKHIKAFLPYEKVSSYENTESQSLQSKTASTSIQTHKQSSSDSKSPEEVARIQISIMSYDRSSKTRQGCYENNFVFYSERHASGENSGNLGFKRLMKVVDLIALRYKYSNGHVD